MSGHNKAQHKVPAVEMAEGAGARVLRVFPTMHMRHLDPFVLLDEFFVKPDTGFPEHEHRGFEAITYMLDGSFHHKDNAGNDSVVAAGGVQRFSAGKSLSHSEMPGSDAVSHGIQLWINLPRGLKNSEPDYQQIESSALPGQKSSGIFIRTIGGPGSPLQPHTSIRYIDVTLDAGTVFQEEISAQWTGLVYVLENSMTLGSMSLHPGEAAILEPDAEIRVVTEEKTRFVLITGKPHHEPIRLHGSFVD